MRHQHQFYYQYQILDTSSLSEFGKPLILEVSELYLGYEKCKKEAEFRIAELNKIAWYKNMIRYKNSVYDRYDYAVTHRYDYVITEVEEI